MNGVRAVVIGASAGGVAALFQVLGTLPSAFAIPVLCVLHLPDDRQSQLAGVMQRRLHRPVCEARDKERIRSGQIYVAGPGYHLSVERDLTLSLSQEEPVHFSRPAIDFLFISTHSNELHAECIRILQSHGYSILASADLEQTYSVDGLIVARGPRVFLPAELAISKKPRENAVRAA